LASRAPPDRDIIAAKASTSTIDRYSVTVHTITAARIEYLPLNLLPIELLQVGSHSPIFRTVVIRLTTRATNSSYTL